MSGGKETAPDWRSQTVEHGMILMAMAMLIAPSVGAMGKWMSSSMSPGEIAWARFFFQGVCLAPFVAYRFRGLGPHLGLQVLRGVLVAGATLFFFAAVQVMPLADAMAIFFVEPLVLTLMSALFLGEPIGWRRITAALVGFAGALIIIQPSYRVFGIEAVFPLGTAVCLAAFLMLTRRLAVKGDPLMLQMSASIFGCATMTVALGLGAAFDLETFAPSWPTPVQWGLMALIGGLGTLSHTLIVYAFRLARASVLAPFQYLEIISATALGFFMFGDFPKASMWIGVAIIVGAGLYVFNRERGLARRDLASARNAPAGPVEGA